MTTALWIGVAAVALGLLIVLVVMRGPARKWAAGPVVLRRGHLIVLAVALTLPACLAMVVSLAGRIKLDTEIRDQLRRDKVTREQIAGIAQAQAMLLRPTPAEQLRRVNQALKTCSANDTCRTAFVRTVNRIIRSPEGRTFTVAPRRARPVTPAPAPPHPPAPIVPAPLPPSPRPQAPAPDERVDGLVGDVATLRRQVAELLGRKTDSEILVGLDHRLADVEDLTQRVISTLCSPALVRLLKLLGVCA